MNVGRRAVTSRAYNYRYRGGSLENMCSSTSKAFRAVYVCPTFAPYPNPLEKGERLIKIDRRGGVKKCRRRTVGREIMAILEHYKV